MWAGAVDRGVRLAQRAGTASDGADETGRFVALIGPHWADMSRFADRLVGRESASDVLQEALASAWRSRHKFDRDVGSPRAWLLAIVANEARDHRRAAWRRGRQMLVEDGFEDRSGWHADQTLALDMTAALNHLSDRQRSAVALHYYLGFSVADCAEVLGCAPGTVKSTLSDARRRLRALLGEDYR